ncbi:hypothetical protein NOF55_05065 [Rhizobiaceae bacterium BDR2-2]|uniref:Cell division protein FtsL n=1 Tax=Ectorhizobium quercum TaxID=2965071 RepID=A0AAE3STY9_9HYPH|nr:hypothetical protein [Ectorhizobium quercum]MCX8996472.1 hypothetical protein [Ectorhizobium quercum]
MFRAFDLLLIGMMVVAATITYQIKHRADEKLQEVRRLQAEIKLERDTIELLKADWALLSQPNRLRKLVEAYNDELKLEPTQPTQLARPSELPMLRSQAPQPEVAEGAAGGEGRPNSVFGTVIGGIAIPALRPDTMTTGSVNR